MSWTACPPPRLLSVDVYVVRSGHLRNSSFSCLLGCLFVFLLFCGTCPGKRIGEQRRDGAPRAGSACAVFPHEWRARRRVLARRRTFYLGLPSLSCRAFPFFSAFSRSSLFTSAWSVNSKRNANDCLSRECLAQPLGAPTVDSLEWVLIN